MNGYVDALLAGNALATHDLEGAYLKTALGQDIYTQHSYQGGHYNHIDTINKVKYHGSIPAFIEKEGIDNGIIYSCVKKKFPLSWWVPSATTDLCLRFTQMYMKGRMP